MQHGKNKEISEFKPVNVMTVTVNMIPPLAPPEVSLSVSEQWNSYANWILKVLNAPSFNIIQFTANKLYSLFPQTLTEIMISSFHPCG